MWQLGMLMENWLQLRANNKLESVLYASKLINAQACDAEMKKADHNCKGSAACGLSTANSLMNTGDNKTVAMLILRNCVGWLFFSTQKTDQESIKKESVKTWTNKQN